MIASTPRATLCRTAGQLPDGEKGRTCPAPKPDAVSACPATRGPAEPHTADKFVDAGHVPSENHVPSATPTRNTHEGTTRADLAPAIPDPAPPGESDNATAITASALACLALIGARIDHHQHVNGRLLLHGPSRVTLAAPRPAHQRSSSARGRLNIEGVAHTKPAAALASHSRR
jgi:hypothetical protein